ncbi:hypothetical protein MKX03_037211 [Papaver bracteatum]|nr:hypothetical protein MKX03_037211 [Papaver bracteatum]
MFGADVTRLLQQFEISKTQSKWRYGKEPIFKLLIGNVSHFSLRSMMLEKQCKSMIGSDENGCICTIKSTMGLPCSHVMQMYNDMKKPIPLTAIDTFWRQLLLKSVNKVREERMFHELTVLGDIEQKWLQGTPHEKEMIESNMNVIARPGATVDLEPTFKKVKPKGGTSTKSRWNDNKRLLSKHELVDKDYEEEYKENKSRTIGKLKSGTKVFPRSIHSQLTPTSAVSLVRTIRSVYEVSSTVIQSHPRTTAADDLSRKMVIL